jgi:hypothetical protein
MSSIEDPEAGTADDQAYFRELEERFLALRGRATLLSAEDWRAARDWRRLGIPLATVTRVMEELFARQRERRSKRGISSLRYFRAAVEAAWEEELERGAGAYRRPADPGPPIEARLAALAAALPAGLPGRAALAQRLATLSGSFEEVEGALAELDRGLLLELRGRLAESELAAVRERVDRAVAGALAALPAEQVAAARRRLEEQALRERFSVPLLSVFSPTALGPTPD